MSIEDLIKTEVHGAADKAQ